MVITSAADLPNDELHAYYYDDILCTEGKVERIEGSLVILAYQKLEAPLVPGPTSMAVEGDLVMLSTLPLEDFKELFKAFRIKDFNDRINEFLSKNS